MLRVGRIAEPAPELPAPRHPAAPTPEADAASSPAEVTAAEAPEPLPWSGSIQIRHVDAGSCNGCEIEIGAAFGPVYDAERYGARLVASPRHADVLLVTGPVTRNMADPLRITYEATPGPKRVIALGDCARGCGVFAQAYGVQGPGGVADVVPVDVEVPGCPPTPEDIVAALRGLTGR
jgi:Ni,Fe-hydrogenase III small subunit